ncbi:ABC transporter ATP-binding protein [Brevibacillus laterosporus]|uniref:ABC transporter ATP-binding protein n=1 Tax=Brevibacillus laterosporus TaxID=1465 RepID=UPI0003829F14|nr:ABC transporter ATP-binding protein [Brevibacillus laterosporus]ATO49026.1 peptide ABC transporter substrate-binding protein [Brevibacillus laterosporus DSM 25]MBG9803342.1 peptide ABC transporter substrate-binding protein [Brevibacillus laterosporus]MED2001936.1 ABC transporter ATP-binding protein [Brevibacillus laterosporus]MED4765890.1 ABC transporter ATP-binding protein [Brevibacillus laterosporus]TPH09233.1 ABC transporter ATP-binding protein [Brevibacillus laterosporus]
MKPKDILVDVERLRKYYPINKGFFGGTKKYVKAVDDISFQIYKGETFGLVGESGCGKSTTGRSIVRLFDVTDGKILFDGHDVAKMSEQQLKPFRKRMQTIFQDPYSSLNPGMTVFELISEPMNIHDSLGEKERKEIIQDLLERVGLKKEHLDRYPHEFSGGQRQRVSIARSLAVKPEFIMCDEPISALDVSVQAQVVNMLEDLQNELGLTYLFIAHDLSMVRHISDRIGVMYLGQLVEVAESNELYDHPAHPYTQALLSSIPIADPKLRNQKRIMMEGDIPSPLAAIRGCKFQSRCPYASSRCVEEQPKLVSISPGHQVACHLFSE